jgi:RimJ/RimL family protein N-acetyltransferase
MKNIWRSKRLLYRAFEIPADGDFLHSVQSDPEIFINSNNFLPCPWSLADVVEWRKSMSASFLLYVVICKIPESKPAPVDDKDKATGDVKDKKPDSIPVGFFSLRNLPHPHLTHHRSVHMGISIAKEHHGNGYGPEAIHWGLNWAFRMAGLHRVGLEVFEYNVRAQKLYETIGFVKEGTEREGCWYDGKWWDIVSMGILCHEWEKLQSNDVA